MLWLWLACSGEVEKVVESEPTLLEASQEIIFASTEALGAHRLRSVYEQTEYHGEDLRTQSKQVLQLDWQDWDNWQVTQLIDGEVVTQVHLMNGKCLEQVAGKYIERSDGEPYRIQLRSMWNQWDDLMRHFEPTTTWLAKGQSIIEERKVEHYQADFAKPTKNNGGLIPKSLAAEVWVDEQTAVRLVGKVEASLIKGPYKKEVSLLVERSEIGQSSVGERLAEQWSTIQVIQE